VGILIDANDVHPAKALFKIDETVLGIVTEVNVVHPAKAPNEITDMVLGIIATALELHSEQVEHTTPLTVTISVKKKASGKIIDFIFTDFFTDVDFNSK